MPSTGVALYVFLLLMPGLISQAVFELISIRPLKSPANRLIDAALFAAFDLIVYFGLTLIFKNLTFQFVNFEKVADIPTITGVAGGSVVVLFGVSVAVGFVVSFFYNKDWVVEGLRKIKVTSKYSRPTLWMQVYETYGGPWVRIQLRGGKMIEGAVKINSDLDTDKGLLLEDVKIYNAEYEEMDSCPGLYIELNEEILFVQLFHEKFEDQRSKFKERKGDGDAPTRETKTPPS